LRVSFVIKEALSSSLLNISNSTLKIKTVLANPKKAPRILFGIPKAKRFRDFSSILARVNTIIRTKIKVIINEMIGVYFGPSPRVLTKTPATKLEKCIPQYAAKINAINEASSITNPLEKPL
jgi:hypothetical protein